MNKNLKMMDMDEVYEELDKAGKTDVESLLEWMKESNIIASETENNVRQLFNDVADKQRVELDRFKEVLAKVAAEQSKTAEQLSKQLADEGSKFINAAAAGYAAFKDILRTAGK